ncbi:hypothetical protein [Salinicoccus halitifaciens]|uniref:ABC-2 type transport system permease protein n=1 Tax=Salinicoccus halitifaciens TaxID=1073415 RepID=A0ABV2EBC1_9STAP|nr:hypothetical protein [Salinicoccus halitifaciens]MCD2138943.1 hypothetical protein [Salinicoccus halitifaciens]
MKSPTLLWNSTLLRHFTVQTFWITVLYMMMSLIVLPLSLWIFSLSMTDASYLYDAAVFENLASVHLVFGMIYAAGLGLFSMNFKNQESVSDFIHSLPVKRVTVLTSVFIIGISSIIISTGLIAAILMVERFALAFELAALDVLSWLVYSIAVMVTVFIITVFTGFFTNHLFIHLQLVIIIFFLPLALWAAATSTASTMFDGISLFQGVMDDDLLTPVVENTFPIFAVMQIYEPISWMKWVIWAGVALLAFILSYILYARRQNEYVNLNFTYHPVRLILSVLIVIVGMLILGNVVGLIFAAGNIVRVIAFIFAWFVSFILVEMFFQSTVKIRFKVRRFLISAGSAVVFMAVFYAGWNMYSNYVPPVDEVEAVMVDAAEAGIFSGYVPQNDIMSENFLMMDDPAYISDVTQAHQYAADNKVPRHSLEEYRIFEVTYRMKDGSMVHRSFDHYPEGEEAESLLTELNTAGQTRAQDLIYNIEDDRDLVQLSLMASGGSALLIEDGREMERFISEYKEGSQKTADAGTELNRFASEHIINAELEFSNGRFNEWIYGKVLLYHPAVLSRISEEQDISEFISLAGAEEVYAYEIGPDDEFYEDYRRLPFEELALKYDLEALGEDGRTEVMDAVDDGALNAGSGRVIIYTNLNYYPYEGTDDIEADAAEYTHFIVGVE